MEAERLVGGQRELMRIQVRNVLTAAGAPLEAMARDLDRCEAGIGSATWTHRGLLDGKALQALETILLPACNHPGDLLLLTGGIGSPTYMTRWWLEREMNEQEQGGEHGLYLHMFENDDPEDVHSHPWSSASLLVAGRLHDNGATGNKETLSPGDVMLRPAAHLHRVTLEPTTRHLRRRWNELNDNPAEPKAITLIATGRRRPGGWGMTRSDGTFEKMATSKRKPGEPVTR